MLLIFLLILGIYCGDDPCEFTLSSGEDIDLREIPILGLPLTECNEVEHRLELLLCSSLSEKQCPSQHSEGPANACDTFTPSNDYYWVGGLSDWTKSGYDEETKTFNMLYTGKEQADPEKHTRSITVTMLCDEDLTDIPNVVCTGLDKHQSSTMYHIQVASTHACPVTVDVASWMVPLVLIFCCCCCNLFMCLFFIIVGFVMGVIVLVIGIGSVAGGGAAGGGLFVLGRTGYTKMAENT